MEQAAANVIVDAVRSYRKRARSSTKPYPKRRSAWSKGRITRMPSQYKFTRVASTGQSGVQILVGTNTTGSTSFLSGATASQTLQMDFSFDSFRVYLGGTTVATVVVPSYTELGALFDKYRIDKIDVCYTSSVLGNQSMGTGQSLYMPACAYVVDTDDSNVASTTDLQQYTNVKYTQFGGDMKGLKKLASFKPMPSLALYTTGSTVAGAGDLLSKNLWLDAGTANVKHYGFKMALDQLVTSTFSQTWYGINFIVKYHFAFKDVR